MHAVLLFLVVPIGLTSLTSPSSKALSLAEGVFSSSMVVQQYAPLTLWGNARPDEVVTATFKGLQATSTTADEKGAKQCNRKGCCATCTALWCR